MKKNLLMNIFLLFSLISNSQNMQSDKEKLVPFCNKEKKWGYMNNRTKQIVVIPQYDKAEQLQFGVAITATNNTKSDISKLGYLYGAIDENGNEILPCMYKNIYVEYIYNGSSSTNIPDNIIVPENSMGMGVYNIVEKKWIIPEGYCKSLRFYDDNSILINKNELLFNKQRFLCPIDFEIYNIDFKNQLFYIKKNNLHIGIYKWKGNFLIDPIYHYIEFTGNNSNRFAASRSLMKIRPDETRESYDIEIEKFNKQNTGDTIVSDIYDENGILLKSILSKYNIFCKGDIGTYQQNGVEKQINFITLEETTL